MQRSLTKLFGEDKVEPAVPKRLAGKKVNEPIATDEEIDREVRALNKIQLKVNAKAAAEQLEELQEARRKDIGKLVRTGARAMRAEKEAVGGNRLPPVSMMLGPKVKGADGIRKLEAENVNEKVPVKRARKTVNIPAPVKEEVEMLSGEEEEDFRSALGDDVRVEIPQDILTIQGGDEAGAAEALSATFLEGLVSDHVLMKLDDAEKRR